MKIGTNLILLGILSMLIGSAFASPLLISELDIWSLPRVPEGPKADFSVSVAYANFTVQDQASGRVSGGYHLSILDYYIVLNVTNHSDFKAKVARFDFAAAKNITVVPCALGGYSTTSEDPADTGHGSAGIVEGVWLDGEWLNVTWVPEGGLDKIWGIEDGIPFGIHSFREQIFSELNITVHSYGGGSSWYIIEGENFWMEGVPIQEYIYNNEIVATLIYTNGSWTNVTGRIELKEKEPYVSVTNSLLEQTINFVETPESSYPQSGISSGMSSVYSGTDGFNNTWAPHQSRLILLKGKTDVGAFWEGLESLKEGEITLYTGATNYVLDNPVNGTYFDTYSSATELKKVQLEITENEYLYNTILSDNQMFVTDSFGVEVFIEPRN
jgi:hypothetical protein